MTYQPKTVALFGSARPAPGSEIYDQVREQAKLLCTHGWTIATGGGPGLMEAANEGARLCCAVGKVCSLGYSIYLPCEPHTNEHVQRETHHQTFFTRLDQFTSECDAFIANPGGYGTALEILIVLQLKQVALMANKPLILVGAEWQQAMQALSAGCLSQGFIDQQDDSLYEVVGSPVEAARRLIGIDAHR